MISKEAEAEVLRLYHAEKWRIGTIAAQLGLHHTTVQRVLRQTGVELKAVVPRPSMADPFVPFLIQQLEKYPGLCASRLFEMVRERGYPGGADHFRRVVSRHRPRKPAEAFQRLKTLPGDQGQVDWAYFGKHTVGRAERPLWAFVMVLSFSRKVFLRFFLGSSMPFFIRGHVDACAFFGGVPRILLYDNLKSAVLERQRDAIRFNPKLLELAAHYHFEARPVAVARGNEKGRVERAIRYVRDAFFAARKYTDVADLNRQADSWCQGASADRKWIEDKSRTVRDAFDDERGRLLPLPAEPFPAHERVEVEIGKTPLRSLRPQRLLGATRPHPARLDRARRSRNRPHRRGPGRRRRRPYSLLGSRPATRGLRALGAFGSRKEAGPESIAAWIASPRRRPAARRSSAA